MIRRPAEGGPPEVLTEVNTDVGDLSHRFVDVLPGGRNAVYVARGRDGFRIQAVDVETGEVKDLTPGSNPRYSPTGHLLFIDNNATLLAAPFDVPTLELTCAAVPLADRFAVSTNGSALFAVSESGKLVYRTGSIGGFFAPVWVERDGTVGRSIPDGEHRAVRSIPALLFPQTTLALPCPS